MEARRGRHLGTGTLSRGLASSVLSSVRIGYHSPEHFIGGVDAMVLFERALTPAEITKIYEVGRT